MAVLSKGLYQCVFVLGNTIPLCKHFLSISSIFVRLCLVMSNIGAPLCYVPDIYLTLCASFSRTLTIKGDHRLKCSCQANTKTEVSAMSNECDFEPPLFQSTVGVTKRMKTIGNLDYPWIRMTCPFGFTTARMPECKEQKSSSSSATRGIGAWYISSATMDARAKKVST